MPEPIITKTETRIADLDNLNAEQLKTTAIALIRETERYEGIVTQRDAAIRERDEYKASLNAQASTILQQSETLEARQKLIDERDEALRSLVDENRDLEQSIMANEPGDSSEPLVTALGQYGLRLAGTATKTHACKTAVHFIQLANELQKKPTLNDSLEWMITGR